MTFSHIKSFVRREGRLTPRQQNAFNNQAKSYLLPTSDGLINASSIFGREAPLVLEIGFGMGHSLLEMASAHPELDFFGIEVYRPGIGAVVATLEEQNLSNIRIFYGDAMLILPNCLADNSLSQINIFFPDPWPKKRHQKRRLIQAPFVQLLCEKLKPEGKLHLATDWEDYAMQMLAEVSSNPQLENLAGESQFADRGERSLTKYELRGQRLGHPVWDLFFIKR